MDPGQNNHESLLDYIRSLSLGREVMDLMLRGRSAIDGTHGLPIRTFDGAAEFLVKYGFRLENPVESAEVLGYYREALSFIRKYFLRPENPDGAEMEIPKIFFELTDIRELFLWASDKSLDHIVRSRWACSILRVMHAVSHLDKDIRHNFFPEIQKQIFDRFYKEIHSENEKIFLGDPKSSESVPLMKFQTKPRKSRDSLILKILHKKETLAEDVFDQIGLRFVTFNRVDVVRILKYLRSRYIVMPVNIRPSRSRNNLIDPMLFRRTWREARHAVISNQALSRQWIDEVLETALAKEYNENQGEIHENNPFSSSSYRSIQFTCRQLIKYRSPVHDDLKSLRLLLKNSSDLEVKKVLERIDISQLTKEQRFFYPFEVQILDEKNNHEAESGRASHAAYKAAQTQMAMKRVLGQLLPREKRK